MVPVGRIWYHAAVMSETVNHYARTRSSGTSWCGAKAKFPSVMTRRELLRYASLGTLGLFCSSALARSAGWLQEQLQHFAGQDVFTRIVNRLPPRTGAGCRSAS